MDEIAAFAQKFDEGLKVGHEKGREEGREEGIQIGHEKGREEGIQIGEEKGEKQAKIAVAKNSLKAGVSIDVIAQITGLSVNEIKKLRN